MIDGLRLVAALMVVLFHYTFRAPGTWGRPTTAVFSETVRITGYGWLGVQLFFVISGFVICMSAWDRGVGQFFVSRVVRLFPAYWFGVFFTASVVTLLTVRPRATDLFVNLTMLQTPMQLPTIDGSYWTLWEELHFYLLFALLVWRGLTYRRVVVFCLLWTVASVLVTPSPDQALHLLVGESSSPFFVAGMAFYLMHRFGPNLLLWGIVGVSGALGLQRILPTVAIISKDGPFWWPGAIVVLAGIFLVMAAVALGWLGWVRGRWLTAAGALTYPLYLLHGTAGYAIITRLHAHVPKWPLLFGLVAAMLLAAWLVHRFVERPLAPLVRRWLTEALAQMRRGEPEAGAPLAAVAPHVRPSDDAAKQDGPHAGTADPAWVTNAHSV